MSDSVITKYVIFLALFIASGCLLYIAFNPGSESHITGEIHPYQGGYIHKNQGSGIPIIDASGEATTSNTESKDIK